jgi:hypothetical protein
MSEIITPNKTIVDYKGKAVTAEEEPKQEQKPNSITRSQRLSHFMCCA